MIAIRHERAADISDRETLLDKASGATRYRKSSQRLRDGRLPAEHLSFVAAQGRRVVGTARLWNIAAAGCPALLLGPVAVGEDCRSRGIGAALVQHAVAEARRLGHGAVILVGDAPHYGRFGFSAEKTGTLKLPGPFERHPLLALELTAGALDGARGLVRATGAQVSAAEIAVPAVRGRSASVRQGAHAA